MPSIQRVVMLSAVLCLGCTRDRVVPVGHDLDASFPGGGAGGSGGGSAGGIGGGSGGGIGGGAGGGVATDGGEGDGGWDGGADAGPPLDFTAALVACERIDSCLLGGDTGSGYRAPWMNMCLQQLARPGQSAAFIDLMKNRLGFMYVQGWFLPSPLALSEPGTQQCFLAASTCDEVLACFNGGAAVAPCVPVGDGAACVANQLQMCTAPSVAYNAAHFGSAARTFSVDCASYGSTCVEARPDGGTALWGCSPAACTAPACVGSVAQRCVGGLRDEVPCGAGTACQVYDAGNGNLDVGCFPPAGTDCNPATDLPHCDGDRLVACSSGTWLGFDCSAGTRCQTANGSFCGVASECNPAQDPPSCGPDGGVAICAFGARVELPCGAIGMSQCLPGTAAAPALCR